MTSRLKIYAAITGAGILCLLLISSIALTAPGSTVRRAIVFSGYTWQVKSGYGGPGDNYWSDSDNSVWVDSNGYLHLRIRYEAEKWYCSEVYLEKSLGYGRYVFYVASRIDLLKPMVVNGLFLYQGNDHEVDIEFSKWGDQTHIFNTQYAVPPTELPDHLHQFRTALAGSRSTHIIEWVPAKLHFQSIHGFYNAPPRETALIQEWAYPGDVSKTLALGDERLHVNLWLDGGCPTGQACDAEAVIASFHFVAA